MTSHRLRFSIPLLAIELIGCAAENTGTSPPSEVSLVFNAAQAPTIEFALPDMMCEDGCAQAVEDILECQPGVKEVQVDFEGKTATVAIDEGAFDSQQALAALVDKGFDNSKLASESSATEPIAATSTKPEPDPPAAPTAQ